jgi:uncharacterized membrane protein (DUF2068 family)
MTHSPRTHLPDRARDDAHAPAHPHANRGLQLIAVFEAAKGLLVLAAGFGVLGLAHKDIEALGANLLEHLHLNPANGLPRVFLDALAKVHDRQLWLLALGALAYAAVRFAEGWGLWHARRWAEWLGAASAAIYVPFEVRELLRAPTWLHAGILVVNLAIVAYLSRELFRRQAA